MRLSPCMLAIALTLTVGVVAGRAAAQGEPRKPTPAQSALRERIDVGTGWRFAFGAFDATVTTAAYDDSGWERVDVPHTWNRLGSYSLERDPLTDTRQGTGWYRRKFQARPAPGRRWVVEFEAVGAIADVWVNGTHVGQHRGAFTRFRFDVTDHVLPGVDNLLVVRADNSAPESGSSTEHVTPISGDFFVHGGIYRGVSLIGVASTQIDLFDHGGPGVYVSTPVISADRAEVAVVTRLRSFERRPRRLRLVTSILDANGQRVASESVPVRIDAAGTAELRRSLTLQQPHLWNGQASPYLYTLSSELRDGPRVLDRTAQSFGVRSFRFDPDNGFFLNDKPLRLLGASRHQDRAGKGWALSGADHAEDLALMQEMGATMIRQAHYPHAQEWTDLSDRAGLIVLAEAAFGYAASLTNDAPTPAFIANAEAQLIELIRQNYNHPSIVTWTLGNEVDISAALEGKGRPSQAKPVLRALQRVAHQEDPTRPTSYADCCENTNLSVKGAEVMSDVADVAGYNRYFGWYYGRPWELGAALDELRSRHPGKALMLTEYGAGGALTQHTDDPQGGPIASRGRPHPEDYASWVHEESWKSVKSLGYLSAIAIWQMFDSASARRQEGDATDINNKGLVTFDRRTRKDLFYFYKANWSTAPVLHIAGRSHVDRAYAITHIRVYSNAAAVTLTLNGKPLGTEPCPDAVCVWRNVALDPGRNVVSATAMIAGQTLADSVEWTAPDRAAGLRIDSGTLTGFVTADGARYGSDAFFRGGDFKALNPPTLGGPPRARRTVTGGNPTVHETFREGAFQYDIRIPNGRWTATLEMIEPDPALADTRSFDVAVDGELKLSQFRPAHAFGGALKAGERQIPVTVTNGRILLEFIPRGGAAVVSALRIEPR